MATLRQLEYLHNLGYRGTENLSVEDASKRISDLLRLRETSTHWRCPYCGQLIPKDLWKTRTCRKCGRRMIRVGRNLATEAEVNEATEKCSQCGRVIINAETPFVWQEAVICKECFERQNET